MVSISTPIVSVDWLHTNMNAQNLIILDGTINKLFDASQKQIPQTRFFDIKKCFSNVNDPFPSAFPSTEQFQKEARVLGINNDSAIVVYDDKGIYSSARVWWLFKAFGYENVAVLDGGFPAWVTAGHPIQDEIPTPDRVSFNGGVQVDLISSADDVLQHFGDPGYILIDSRAPERYRGEKEPIDTVAGRIPGAINYPFTINQDSNNHLHIKQVLKGRFKTMFGDVPVENVTFYCGSGVTAALNVLAVSHAGLGMPRIYAGSWSEWITDPGRPITSGE